MNKYGKWISFDLPVPYKGLEIYPVKMFDWHEFLVCSSMLVIDKNNIPDVNIIQMSYFEFLLNIVREDTQAKALFDDLLKIVFKLSDDDEFIYGWDNENNPVLRIKGTTLNKSDFEEIRNIIIEQNLLEPPNDNIAKSLQDAKREEEKIRQRQSGKKTAGIEDQMVSLSVATGIPLSEIYGMTIRKFSKSLQRVDHTLHYKIYLGAKMGGMVEFKDPKFPSHWLVDLDKDDDSDLVWMDSFEGGLKAQE